MHKRYWTLRDILYLIKSLLAFGLDFYIIFMIFIMASIGLAKIILKISKKANFKYSNLFLFCMIGLILSVILKIFNFDLSNEYAEVFICLIINIIVFVAFKYIKKILISKFI